jgi:hypothetical protein
MDLVYHHIMWVCCDEKRLLSKLGESEFLGNIWEMFL